ncbi:MAG: hypothetical protein K2O91_06960 [Lachnospiraceae bacterium]|nr:hypothetical protein [Lachnospiraceae bacterium]
MEYGIWFVIRIFDLCIYWRALEAFVGKRKTSVEFAIALLVVSEAAGSLINQMGINWLNLIAIAVLLGIFICQYEEKVSAKVIIVLMYMRLVAVAEPAGYVIYTFFERNQVKNEAITDICNAKRSSLYAGPYPNCKFYWLFPADRGGTGTVVNMDCHIVYEHYFYHHHNELSGIPDDRKIYRHGREKA